MRKKIAAILIVAVIAGMTLAGCAKVQFKYAENFELTISRSLTIDIDKDYLSDISDKGYEPEQLKEFLFKYFAFINGKLLSDGDAKLASLRFPEQNYDDDGRFWSLKYAASETNSTYVVKYEEGFFSEEDYIKYYKDSQTPDEETKSEYPKIKKGFLFYEYTYQLQSPFKDIKSKLDSYYDRIDPEDISLINVFLHGYTDKSTGIKELYGFRDVFTDIPQSVVDDMVFEYVYAYARGKIAGVDAQTYTEGFLTNLKWDLSGDKMDSNVYLVVYKPNSVGWNTLVLLLTAVVGAVFTTIVLLRKKLKIKKPPIASNPPVNPPSPPNVFDGY